MSYPPQLNYYLDRLNSFSTNTFKLFPQNAVTASPNQIVRFTLPNNSLLNLKSFAFRFSASTSGTGAIARLPADISTLIERVEVTSSGVQLASGANFYNVLKQAMSALKGDSCDPVLGHSSMVREVSYVDGAAKAGNETYTGSSALFSIDKWEGFLGSSGPGILDSSLLGELVISLTLADNNVLSSSVGTTLPGTGVNDFDIDGNGASAYSLSNMYATVEAMSLASSGYDEMIQGIISEVGFVEVPFKQYMSFQDTVSQQMRWSVATQSLDKIIVVHRDAEYNAIVAPRRVAGYKVYDATNTLGGIASYDAGGVLDTNKELYKTAFSNFVEPSPAAGTVLGHQFQINGANLPNFQASTEDMLSITRNAVGIHHAQNKLGLDSMRKHFCVYAVRLNLPGSEENRLISGLDSRATNLSGYYNIFNVGATKPVVNLFAECTSTLRIGASGQLEVIN